jgi:hypothetical protein
MSRAVNDDDGSSVAVTIASQKVFTIDEEVDDLLFRRFFLGLFRFFNAGNLRPGNRSVCKECPDAAVNSNILDMAGNNTFAQAAKWQSSTETIRIVLQCEIPSTNRVAKNKFLTLK